ncbi:MAG: DUF2018 family protein [Arcobacteraceae bacterium]
MSKYTALLEDENDIFAGTPQSKFWDIVNSANDELVKEQVDKMFEKFTAMESLLTNIHGEEKLHQMIQEYSYKNSIELESNKKSTYVEITSEIISQLDS